MPSECWEKYEKMRMKENMRCSTKAKRLRSCDLNKVPQFVACYALSSMILFFSLSLCPTNPWWSKRSYEPSKSLLFVHFSICHSFLRNFVHCTDWILAYLYFLSAFQIKRNFGVGMWLCSKIEFHIFYVQARTLEGKENISTSFPSSS